MNILKLDSKLNLDETNNEIEHARIQLDRAINLEDSSSIVIEEFKNQIEEINQILFQFHTDNKVDSNSLLEKSKKLKYIGKTLVEAGNKYQESFSKTLLQQIEYWGLWFQGTAKEYEIHVFIKDRPESSEQNLLEFTKLMTNFVENYWKTHPEKILEREEFALKVLEAENSDIPNNYMSEEFKKVSQKFISTTLSVADKVRLEKIKNCSHSVKQMIDWVTNSPKWQGDDLESCLDIVENSRIKAEF